METKKLQPKQFLFLLIAFALMSVFLSERLFVKAYSLETSISQFNDNLQPLLREEEVRAAESTQGVCGSPVVIYEDTQNCTGGGSVDVDFSENNGGSRSGTYVYSKDLSLKVSKVTIPLGVLSGTDINSTNLSLKNDSYILPASSSMFTDTHEDVGRVPSRPKVEAVEYDIWATKGEVSFSELEEPSQESNVVVEEYVPSNTEECATCSTNPDKSEKIGKLVNDRTLPPGHSEDVEAYLPVLMCKDEDSISVTPKGVACIDEGYSVLKRVTAIFSGSDWEQCNQPQYDEEGNLISDGKCINIEDVVLDLSGIFQNTNSAYKKIVDNQMNPDSGYTCEMSLSFPAWVEIDGRGIYKVSAKINVPYECWRKNQEFDDTDSETPSDVGLKAFIKYIESLSRNSISF